MSENIFFSEENLTLIEKSKNQNLYRAMSLQELKSETNKFQDDCDHSDKKILGMNIISHTEVYRCSACLKIIDIPYEYDLQPKANSLDPA